MGAFPRSLRRSIFQSFSGSPAWMDHRLADRGDACVGGCRLRRPRALADLDDRLFPCAWLRATQDVVIDGWRITVAPVERQALMSSWSEVGWRIGNLVAGAGAPPT